MSYIAFLSVLFSGLFLATSASAVDIKYLGRIPFGKALGHDIEFKTEQSLKQDGGYRVSAWHGDWQCISCKSASMKSEPEGKTYDMIYNLIESEANKSHSLLFARHDVRNPNITWVLQVAASGRDLGIKGIRSIMYGYEINCSQSLGRIVLEMGFTDYFGRGNIASQNNQPTEWGYIPPNTNANTVAKYACNKEKFKTIPLFKSKTLPPQDLIKFE